jgi:4-amino-4-deoxy-L-arabinose transferase-like glycosyltransferase
MRVRPWTTLPCLVVQLGGKVGGKLVSLVDGTSRTRDVTAESAERRPELTRAPRMRTRRAVGDPDSKFWLGLAGAVTLGAVVRFLYLFHGAPRLVLGDGLDYHLQAERIADGLGYTAAIGPVGTEYAHHPPGWVTLLAGVTEAGGRSMWAHQVTGLVIGLGVIAVAGLVGRRYVGRRVGVLAALLAAVYPGFWVLDVQILSEPLGLLVLGVLMIVLADLRDRPTVARAILAGAAVGVLTLVRGEQLALLAIAVAPILLLNRRLGIRQRLVRTGVAALVAAVVLMPWAIYNMGRFEEPTVLSTNLGTTLLAGNCPPMTYSGDLIGSYDLGVGLPTCIIRIGLQKPGLDASQIDVEARDAAVDNALDNLDRMPVTILARYGRTIGVFRPAQTVAIDAEWLGSATWPVWAWVSSFWLLAPLALYGSVLLRRSGRWQWPLVAPAVIVLVVVTTAFGVPRYHTLADLGLVVLAAVAIDRLARRVVKRRRPAA